MPSETSLSTTRFSSLAFGRVVLICSCLISALAMFMNSARRCDGVRLSLRPLITMSHDLVLSLLFFVFIAPVARATAGAGFTVRMPVCQKGSSSFFAISSMFSGGQFGISMPRCRPIWASTSLISFRDLRPKFGVRSISASVFCTRSPI